MRRIACIVLVLLAAASARGENVRLATYNIENFHTLFEHRRMAKLPPPNLPQEMDWAEMVREQRNQNQEDRWEVAQVVTHPRVDADIIVIQEGCLQEDLEYFNKQWLDGVYDTVIVFPTNTTRNQTLAMMLKPGFKVLEQSTQYHLEPDPVSSEPGARLFARGPAFCLVETPGGYRMWVGTTHQKSKSGNSVEVTQWRNREAQRTREIILELKKNDPHPVILLGDFNDELGIQEYELEGGGDVIANMIGDPADGLHLATRTLALDGEISFGGYWFGDRRSFIDHVIVTRDLRDKIQDVYVFQGSVAPVASDHYPVIVALKLPGAQ
jgi:endonuclease/exonuclease/phosphatase family metal-dependent hydrolase